MITILTASLIAIPWLGAFVVWSVGDRRARAQHSLAVSFALLGAACAVALIPMARPETVLSLELGSAFGTFTLVPDGLGVFIAAIASVVGSLAVIYSVAYMRGKPQLGRYYGLVLFFIGAMAGLALSGSALFMFFFWEITALCSYALISFFNDKPEAVAGGLKALIVTQLGGVGLLAGALLIYAATGSYQLDNFLAQAGTLPPATLQWIAFGLLAAAVAKSAQVPLHTWLPDAMEAPTSVTALIHAATMVNAGVYLLARLYPACAAVPGWKTAVISIGAVSALLAGVMALTATDLKRVLAYSTVSQLGYMVYAVGTGAIFASQFHLLSHACFKALLFLSAGAVISAVGTRDMRKMGGLSRQMPFVRTVFLIGALGLAGLPLANGFFSKELVLEYGLLHGPLGWYLVMLLGAGITAAYTLRMVAMVFFGPASDLAAKHDGPLAMRVALGCLAAATLSTWLLAGAFEHLLAATLPYHGLHAGSLAELLHEILLAPTTWLTVGLVLASGLAWWLLRESQLAQALRPFAALTQKGFGFEEINQWVIRSTQTLAAGLQRTQTGQLNWNIFGLLAALLAVLLILTQSV